MKRPPIQRRHLGDFVVRDFNSGVIHHVAVYVNAEMIVKDLGLKAANNKNKRSRAMRGAILVEVES